MVQFGHLNVYNDIFSYWLKVMELIKFIIRNKKEVLVSISFQLCHNAFSKNIHFILL